MGIEFELGVLYLIQPGSRKSRRGPWTGPAGLRPLPGAKTAVPSTGRALRQGQASLVAFAVLFGAI